VVVVVVDDVDGDGDVNMDATVDDARIVAP